MARTSGEQVTAWRPDVPGVAEVFHARFTDHVYPAHTHRAWTLLIVDDGAVRFDLERHPHGALRSQVTLLPPHVPHDGRSATPHGFRKRVVYLDAEALDFEGTAVLGTGLIGAAVDNPGWADPVLRHRVDQLHRVLAVPGERLEAQSRLAFVVERLERRLRGERLRGERLRGEETVGWAARAPGLADRLRELLDERVVDGVSLEEAASVLHAHPTHLVRAFSRRHGMPPHRYLTGRRVDLARRLLLAGQPAAEVAAAAGFYDQSHLHRHFTRLVGVSPTRFARR